MTFFREPEIQVMLIRILYVYSHAHPTVSYNQGMGELLATILYLLYIEQWPTEGSSAHQPSTTLSTSGLGGSMDKTVDTDSESDGSYVDVGGLLETPEAASALDPDSFLQLKPFSGNAAEDFR